MDYPHQSKTVYIYMYISLFKYKWLWKCELGLNRDICNVNGGAIALGNPTGASGSRIIGHLAHQMKNDKDLKYTIGSACIGGGQGIAILLENC